MVSDILLVIDASDSMTTEFLGVGNISKFEALKQAINEVFRRLSEKKLKETKIDKKRLGAICYRTRNLELMIETPFPLRYIPPFPFAGRLDQVTPRGSSPLPEALLHGCKFLSASSSEKKILGLMTGDCVSNFKLRVGNVEKEVVPNLKKVGLKVAVIQIGMSERNEFEPLTQALQEVLLKQPLVEPRTAVSVNSISKWLEALLIKT